MLLHLKDCQAIREHSQFHSLITRNMSTMKPNSSQNPFVSKKNEKKNVPCYITNSYTIGCTKQYLETVAR